MTPAEAWIHEQWRIAESIVGDNPAPRYYDDPHIVDLEEQGGISVPDAVLARVLSTTPSQERRQTTLRVASLVAEHVRHDQVVNQCHNLGLELFMMLDQLGIPSIVVWGTLLAESIKGEFQFLLTPYVEKQGADHRPGHSWVMTPELKVIDVALKHQAWVAGAYDQHRDSLPDVVIIEQATHEVPPEPAWFHQPGAPPLSPELLERDAMKYWPVLGWSEVQTGSLQLRYLPNALGLPNVGDDLHRALPLIDGQTPHRFFTRTVKRALRSIPPREP